MMFARTRRAAAYTAVALLCAIEAAAANPAVTVTVDAQADRHAIDPRIYGSSFANAAQISAMGLTLNRWGGNAMSRYNWAFSTANRAKDWYFENIPDDVSSGDGSNGKSADDFISLSKGAGAEPVMTIPLMGLLPKDRVKRCGYSITKYGAQDANDWEWMPDCGNGKSGGVRMLHVNDPADTAAVYGAAHQADWVQHLIDTWGSASEGGVRYYSLDNEPSLWSGDHWDVHPDGATYDEVWGKMAEYGAAIKAKDPDAILTGVEEWGWSGYFKSGLDQENSPWPDPDPSDDNEDRDAHGGVAYIDWLMQQAAAYEAQHGVRILDLLAVHFYPQSGEFSSDVSANMQLMRNRSTRALWDTAYLDESWIRDVDFDPGDGRSGGYVRLIPRLKDWVANHYQGTQIGITEYNWGADNHINGATAQADILGIFGREGLDMGVRWGTPAVGSFTANAFRMYRNYDGNHAAFGDMSVRATGPDPDQVAVFAAQRSSDGALTIMLIAKVLSDGTPATVNLANFAAGGDAERWQLDAGNAIVRLADVTPAAGAVSLTLPAQSITLLVIPPAPAAGAPVMGEATATSTSQVTIAWSAVGGAEYHLYRSFGGGDFQLRQTTMNTSFNDSGLTANTTYLYKVLAVVGGVPSEFSAIEAATTTMFTDSDLAAGMTVKAAHVTELRTAVNAMRVAANLPAQVFAGGALPEATVLAQHLTELRAGVSEARSAIGLPAMSWVDAALGPGTVVKTGHVTGLRQSVR